MEAYYLPEQIICNAWMKKGYAFTNEEEVEDRNGGCFFNNDANIDSDVELNVFEGEV